MKIILASKSPRRKELLLSLGLDFEIVESDFKEYSTETEPYKYVMDLSFHKSMNVARRIKEDAVVIGADTVVVVDDMILGKPKDRNEAYNMLKSLSGKFHTVYTGVSVVRTHDMKCIKDFEVTKVWIKKLEDDIILRYINKGECDDKAGAYAIQGFGALIVEKIEGDYFNVVGLPLSKLSDILRSEFCINLL